MTKETLTKIARYTTKNDGTPLVTKDGRPYTSVRIKTEEHGDRWISGFENPVTKNWKEGDEVEIEVVEKGEYLNFTVPKPADKVDEKLEMILNRLVAHTIKLEQILGLLVPKKETPNFDEPDDEVPF